MVMEQGGGDLVDGGRSPGVHEEVAQLVERAAVVGLYDAAGAELADRAVRTADPDVS